MKKSMTQITLDKLKEEWTSPLRAALEEAREVLSLCSTRRFDAPEDDEVGALGARLGYGAVMSAASKEWAKMFDGTPQTGSQHTTGPAEATVRRTIEIIDKALGSPTSGEEKGET